MQHGIREFRPRQPLDRQLGSETLNRILRELESLRITRVVNGTFKKLPGGTEIVVAPQSGGGGTPATIQPWDLIAQVDPDADPEDENPPYLVRVRPGTLNGILPTNWDIEEECAATGLFYAKAVIATDGEAITGVTIEIDASPPAVQEPVEFGIAARGIFVWPFLRGCCLSGYRRGANCPANPHLASDQRRPRGRARRIALRHLLSARATGVTVVEGSSSSSFDYNISGTDAGGTIVGQTDSATASGLTTYTFASLTSVAASGTTTTWSSSSSETSTGAGSISNTGIEYDENGDPQTTQTLSTGSFGGGNSASSSFSATSQSTAQIQTSTTETFEQIYEVTTVITEGGPFDSIWTTSTNTYGVDKTSTVFYQTAGTQTTSLGTTFSTTTETIDTITYLDQTITLTALPDTVIQANTKKAQLAEVIYKITQTISNVTAFSAATEAAVSGTRLTISPSFRTEAKVAAHSTRPTSSIELIESTSLFVITNSRTTSLNATNAQYVSFPPVTETLTVAGLTTTQSTLGTNYLDFQIDDTHGGTTSTVTECWPSPHTQPRVTSTSGPSSCVELPPPQATTPRRTLYWPLISRTRPRLPSKPQGRTTRGLAHPSRAASAR
jgi:hypothetical protein